MQVFERHNKSFESFWLHCNSTQISSNKTYMKKASLQKTSKLSKENQAFVQTGLQYHSTLTS